MSEQTTMPAGRALDALIAEKVMGWTWRFNPGSRATRSLMPSHFESGWPEWDGNDDIPIQQYSLVQLPAYSTDIAAAWQVWEKIGQPTISKSNPRGQIMVWVAEDYMGPDEVAEADTAPLAICRAALQILVDKESEKR